MQIAIKKKRGGGGGHSQCSTTRSRPHAIRYGVTRQVQRADIQSKRSWRRDVTCLVVVPAAMGYVSVVVHQVRVGALEW
jgi:hypothetical protein